MSNSTFEGTIEVSTPKAILFQGVYWEGPLWFPRSQIRLLPDGEFAYVVVVKDWLCRKRDLLEFTAYNEADIERMSQ